MLLLIAAYLEAAPRAMTMQAPKTGWSPAAPNRPEQRPDTYG